MSLNTYLAIALCAALLFSPVLLLLSPLAYLWVRKQRAARTRLGLQLLLPSQADSTARIAEAMIHGPAPASGWEGVAARIDGYLATSKSSRTWRVLLLYSLIEWAPWLRLRPRFSRQSKAQRQEFVGRYLSRTHGLFGLLALTRQLVRLAYYGECAPKNRIGYVAVEHRGPMRRMHASGTQPVSSGAPALTPMLADLRGT